MNSPNLGNLLVEEGFLLEKDRLTVRETCGFGGASFAKGILALGLLDQEELASLLATRTNVPRTPKQLGHLVNPNAVGCIDLHLIKKYEVVPLRVEGKNLVVAMVDPLDRETIASLEFFTGYKIRPMIATLKQVREQIEKIFPDYEPNISPLEEFLKNHVESATKNISHKKRNDVTNTSSSMNTHPVSDSVVIEEKKTIVEEEDLGTIQSKIEAIELAPTVTEEIKTVDNLDLDIPETENPFGEENKIEEIKSEDIKNEEVISEVKSEEVIEEKTSLNAAPSPLDDDLDIGDPFASSVETEVESVEQDPFSEIDQVTEVAQPAVEMAELTTEENEPKGDTQNEATSMNDLTAHVTIEEKTPEEIETPSEPPGNYDFSILQRASVEIGLALDSDKAIKSVLKAMYQVGSSQPFFWKKEILSSDKVDIISPYVAKEGINDWLLAHQEELKSLKPGVHQLSENTPPMDGDNSNHCFLVAYQHALDKDPGMEYGIAGYLPREVFESDSFKNILDGLLDQLSKRLEKTRR